MTADEIHALLRRLQGTGYSLDDAAIRTLELRSYAEGLATGSDAVARVGVEALPTSADELLEEWEDEYRLPNDAARTETERRARLRATESARGGAPLAAFAAALEDVAAGTVEPLAPTPAEADADAAEDAARIQVAVKLGSADYADSQIRRALARVAARALPVRNLGQLDAPDVPGVFFVDEGALWNDATQILGRTAIGRQTATTYELPDTSARVRSYAPLSVLRARDLNAIQEGMLPGFTETAASAVSSYPNDALVSGHRFWVSYQQSTGPSTDTVDSSIDWRDRIVWAAFGVAAAADDIKPGGAADSTWASVFQYRVAFYTGNNAGSTQIGASNRLLECTSNNLVIRTTTSERWHFVGFVRCSPQLGYV